MKAFQGSPWPRILLLTAVCCGGFWAYSAEDPTGSISNRRLAVATKESPPFAFKTSDGDWAGVSIELWEDLADDLSLEFDYRELTLAEMLDQAASGEIDVVVSALTITPERESRMDFSYPYYEGGLGMALALERESVLWGLLRRIFSWHFLSAVLALATVLFIAAFCVWFFERRANPEQFGGSRLQGLGASFWWSAVTMTTVGYGDKAPRSVGGRVVALIWMFTSIIIISSFTAGIATSLTASQVAADQLKNRPLHTLAVATVARSTAQDFVESTGLRSRAYPTITDALQAVHNGDADVVIYDLPLLKYHLMKHPNLKAEVLPNILVRESYAIGLPSESNLREPLNRILLETVRTREWRDLLSRYLGGE